MSNQTRERTEQKRNPGKVNTNSDAFDFDLWAKEVRNQMLAVLQKRSSN
ncbi:hypothetical protein PN462_05485 [Spirulina sp. CS-785/01]|nr:hypothetical protein [Spirulina sp. CS-785/01]MDB9312550.1 hypothetical protein [Spirulina sp. CS-785/01]